MANVYTVNKMRVALNRKSAICMDLKNLVGTLSSSMQLGRNRVLDLDKFVDGC